MPRQALGAGVKTDTQDADAPGDDLGFGGADQTHGDVRLLPRDVFQRVVDAQFELQPRMAMVEVAQQAGQYLDAQQVAAGDPDGSVFLIRFGAGHAVERLRGDGHRFDMLDQSTCRIGGCQAGRGPCEKTHVQRALQRLQPSSGRGLCDAKQLRGPAQAA